MSETNDTLAGATSAEILATQQAEGQESSDITQSPASQETPGERLYAGKYRTVEEMEHAIIEAQKLIGRKTVNSTEAARTLGLTQESNPAQVQQVASNMSRADARQAAQQVGGDELEQWFVKAAAQFGTATAINALLEHALPQKLSQYLSPINDQLSQSQQRTNVQTVELVTERLARDYDDFETSLPEIKKYLEANPKKRAAIMSTDTDKDEKYDILEGAYLKVSRAKGTTTANASKAAGAVDAKQRETMKAASVTAGSGVRGGDKGSADRADSWLKDMQEHEKGRRLFG